jgi:hypothetical protein
MASKLFATESLRVADEMQKRLGEIMTQYELDGHEAAVELGRVLLMQGATLIGRGLELPHTAALPIGYRALEEFERVSTGRN